MRLGEILVQEKSVEAPGVEEALESQVVNGGRLGTNLLELGLLQEEGLAKALGKQHGTSYAFGEMAPDPVAVRLVDSNFADEKDVIPMRVDANRIILAVLNPGDVGTLDAVAFKTGKRVVPVVIPEFRMIQLLRKHCKAYRGVRAIDMNTIRPSRTRAAKEEKVQEVVGDLMSEEEFQSTYAQALSGGAAEGVEEVLEGTVVEEEETQPVPPPPKPPAPLGAEAPKLKLVPAPPAPAASNWQDALPGQAVDTPLAAAAPKPVPPPPEEALTPLDFAGAQAELKKSSDREDIAETIIRFAIGKWKRALLLSVQGPIVTGWWGAGMGVRERAVRRIGINLRSDSSFRLVNETRSHFIGPMKRDSSTNGFYKLLGGEYPKTAVLLPLLVRGKVVHILYVDNGPKKITPPDVGELLILSQSVGRSYEELMRRRKSA